MSDLRRVVRSLVYQDKTLTHVRTIAVLETMAEFLDQNAPETANAVSVHLNEQKANGKLILANERSGRVIVVGHYSAYSNSFLWFRDNAIQDAAQAWAKEKASADKIGDGHYAIKFVLNTDELDSPHIVTESICRIFTNVLSFDNTVFYESGQYCKGGNPISQEQADSAYMS